MPLPNRRPVENHRAIFDVLYGFIPLTEWEAKIIDSPFFQRLRWIKQLGFSSYIFPGAEHNRFSHTIGVMNSMDQMLQSLGIAVPTEVLFNPKSRSKEAMLHKSCRIAALLHDIGTFPFSHAIEYSYIKHGNDNRTRSSRSKKDLPNSHEHLGSFIIKNTNYEGGLTQILEEYGFDVQMLSKIIKGDSPYLIANQLMHSDLDADRMDYLVRDSHYTGIKYGQFDRDFILANLVPYDAGKGQLGFGIRESATVAVEDFLISRFNWYSQVIKNPESAKYDVIASNIAKAFLEKNLIHQFHDLLEMIQKRDERFFWWNDIYFMTRCQEIHHQKLIQDPKISELIQMILFRRGPKRIHHPLFKHKIHGADSQSEHEKHISKMKDYVVDLQKTLDKHSDGKAWILTDIPSSEVVFTQGLDRIKKGSGNVYLDRDPVKIITKDEKVKLLVELENSLMQHLSQYTNFIPCLYANDEALKIFKKKKLVQEV